MDTHRRALLTVRAAVPTGLALALTGVVPAHGWETTGDDFAPEDTAYVALGDSFSAGTGTRASTGDCYRSPYGYPALVAGAQGLSLDYQACSGATTADVLAHQVGALGGDTALVTMTIGGNDVGFAEVITECAQPGWASDCAGAIAEGRAILHGELPGRYDTVLAAIGAGAPNADVRIGGYPHLFNGEDCNAATFFSAAEMAELNAATDELDALVEQKTVGAGFGYVDPRAAFDGHAVCDEVEWVNGLSWPIVESYHPNRDGNIGYAEVFWPGSGAAVVGDVPVERDRQSRAETVRERARAVLAMELTSPANLRAAEAAGISPERIVTLVDQLGSEDTTVAAAALEELSVLDEQHEDRAAAHRD